MTDDTDGLDPTPGSDEPADADAPDPSTGQHLEHSGSDVLAALAAEHGRLKRDEPTEDRGGRGRDLEIQAIREVMYALHEVSIGTHQLLYFSAMRYCKNYVEVDADTMDEAIDELKHIFDRLNIGTLEEVNSGDTKARLVLRDNAFTMEEGELDKPICYFLSGYIAGILEQALDSHYVVNEVECIAQGHDACHFKAQKR